MIHFTNVIHYMANFQLKISTESAIKSLQIPSGPACNTLDSSGTSPLCVQLCGRLKKEDHSAICG